VSPDEWGAKFLQNVGSYKSHTQRNIPEDAILFNIIVWTGSVIKQFEEKGEYNDHLYISPQGVYNSLGPADLDESELHRQWLVMPMAGL
jgi:hypothetical protein